MENRGIVASWDEKSQQLTIWDTTQAPIAIRNGLAAMLGLSEHQVRVIAPFIGGGFGPKIMMFYPEEVLLAWAALQLGRPLKWIEDREENFYATTQERGQVHDAAIALEVRRYRSGRERRLSPRRGGLRALRAHRSDQQPVHAPRSLRNPALPLRRSPASSPTSQSSPPTAAPAGSTASL